jgi:hypothetical protein
VKPSWQDAKLPCNGLRKLSEHLKRPRGWQATLFLTDLWKPKPPPDPWQQRLLREARRLERRQWALETAFRVLSKSLLAVPPGKSSPRPKLGGLAGWVGSLATRLHRSERLRGMALRLWALAWRMEDRKKCRRLRLWMKLFAVMLRLKSSTR